MAIIRCGYPYFSFWCFWSAQLQRIPGQEIITGIVIQPNSIIQQKIESMQWNMWPSPIVFFFKGRITKHLSNITGLRSHHRRLSIWKAYISFMNVLRKISAHRTKTTIRMQHHHNYMQTDAWLASSHNWEVYEFMWWRLLISSKSKTNWKK